MGPAQLVLNLGSKPCYRPAASNFPDELSWIIELLEKDSMTVQETLVDPSPLGESSFAP